MLNAVVILIVEEVADIVDLAVIKTIHNLFGADQIEEWSRIERLIYATILNPELVFHRALEVNTCLLTVGLLASVAN